MRNGMTLINHPTGGFLEWNPWVHFHIPYLSHQQGFVSIVLGVLLFPPKRRSHKETHSHCGVAHSGLAKGQSSILGVP